MAIRRVVGKKVVELPEAEWQALRGARPLLLDVGTGDGKHALRLARDREDWLVVGLDANRDNLAKVSGKAAARPDRGGQANLVFVWAAAEQLPNCLQDVAAVQVLMPWGSLLRGLIGLDPVILQQLARAARPGAPLTCTLNLHAWRPAVKEVGDTAEPTPEWAMAQLAPRYAEAGWQLRDAGYLDGAAGDLLTTAWSRRLTSSRDQFEVLVLHAERATPPD